MVSVRNVKFDIKPVKRCFYAAYSSVFSHSNTVHEIAALTSQESVLIYAAPTLNLKRQPINDLNAFGIVF